jgi:cell division septum initiation protein DivIVA
MAIQFGHINDYSRAGSRKNPETKKTTTGCLGEAFRVEGYASHVKEPKEPIILFGSRDEIDKALEAYREGFRDSRGHKLRTDGKELLAGIFSFPPGTTKEKFLESLPTVIYFLIKKYGSSLRCILSHEDEPFLDETGEHHGEIHYHLHFFVVPEPHENFRDYHPGIKAKWQAKKDGLNHWDADQQYKWRMGDWQDELYREVGLPLGLVKERPKELQEKRLSRRQQRIINDAKKTSIKIQDDAKEKLSEANNILKKSKKEAKRIIQSAESEASKINKASETTSIIVETLTKKIEALKVEAIEEETKIEKLKLVANNEAQSIINKSKSEAKLILENAKETSEKNIKDSESNAQVIKRNAWKSAMDITKAAKREESRIINNARVFIDKLLEKVSKLQGGNSIVIWARKFLKSVDKKDDHHVVKAVVKKKR